jgi:GDP-mannose 6-dehydrogenase
MKISIFGLGYVGAVSLACLARDGHDLVGVDIDEGKLDLIRSGRSPIVEEGIVELMANVVRQNRVSVTADATKAILDTELSFVCVGTPSAKNGSQDLTALRRLSEQLGAALQPKDGRHVIVIRSTVEPGTTQKVVIPILEKMSGKVCGKDFSVCFQPEFLREGSSISDYDNPPMTIVGADESYGPAQLRELFGALPAEFIETDIKTAEALKFACNAFHALKITFANEIGRLCQKLGADSQAVMKLLCVDKQLNISEAYLRPGFAFGGSCLPKDLRAVLHMAKNNDAQLPMLAGIVDSNRIQIEHAFEMLVDRGRRPVAVIGLSFKSGTDDLRESPIVDLVERLIGKGIPVKIYDPEVQLSKLMGANKRYIESVVPHIETLMHDTLEETLSDVDSIVIGMFNAGVRAAINKSGKEDHYILDLVGVEDRNSLPGAYNGICW